MGARVGILGLGRMGRPICARLVCAGHEVTAGDRRGELEARTVAYGARWSASPREVAAAADVLVTVLPDDDAVADALLSPGGALEGLREGSVWIDMSSCAPDAGGALAEQAAARGVRCLDAPLGGGVPAAEAGTLQLFVGGDPALLHEQRPLLEAVAEAERIRHMGGHGAGYLTKLLVNLLWFGQALATAEALLIARRAGLDVDVVRDAIGSSAASSPFIAEDLDALLAGDYLTSFGLDRCCAELAAITRTARELGVPHGLASAVEDTYRRALKRYGPRDGELLGVALLEEEAGIRLRSEWP